jgi:prophage regulatory protein
VNIKRKEIQSSNRASVDRPAVDHLRGQGKDRISRLESIPLKFLRFAAVRDRTGLSRSTIWRLERRGEFPRHRRISPNAVGWLEVEIQDWMLTKTATD